METIFVRNSFDVVIKPGNKVLYNNVPNALRSDEAP